MELSGLLMIIYVCLSGYCIMDRKNLIENNVIYYAFMAACSLWAGIFIRVFEKIGGIFENLAGFLFFTAVFGNFYLLGYLNAKRKQN